MSVDLGAEIKKWEPGRRLGFKWDIWALRITGQYNEQSEREVFDRWKP